MDRSTLQTVCKRYIDLSLNFGRNSLPFQLATAFVICSIIKAVYQHSLPDKDFSDESCIGVIFSKDRNVGKSLTLKLLAKGQGIFGKVHPLLCSGGDQTVSGVSLKVLMSALHSTNLTTLVDDLQMTSSLSEFLLQVHSGLPQGSLRTGLTNPVGSILVSTNAEENERVFGRSMRFDFEKDAAFSFENEKALQEDLNKLLDQNKFHKVAGTSPDIEGAICHMLKTGMVSSGEEKRKTFWLKLKHELNQNVSNMSKPVAVNGNFVPAIGITFQELSCFTSIGNKEFKEELSKVVDGPVQSSTMVFASSEEATLKDISKKATGLVKKAKGYKIPKSALNVQMVHKIEYASGMTAGPVEENIDFEEKQSPLSSVLSEVEVVKQCFLDEHEDQNSSESGNLSCDNEEEVEENSSVINELSPLSKLRYTLLSPRTKTYFCQGVMAGRVRMASGASQAIEGTVSGHRDAAGVCSETPQVMHVLQEKESDERRVNIKRCLEFNNANSSGNNGVQGHNVEGSIGVRKRTQTATKKSQGKKKKSQDESKELCKICKVSSPPRKSTEKKPKWVCCESCEHWFHLYCLKMDSEPTVDKWICGDCSSL